MVTFRGRMIVKLMCHTLDFLDYALDASNAQLWRSGQVVPLRAKAFPLLHYLAERPGRGPTREATTLQEKHRIW